jgi:hypothetical protein
MTKKELKRIESVCRNATNEELHAELEKLEELRDLYMKEAINWESKWESIIDPANTTAQNIRYAKSRYSYLINQLNKIEPYIQAIKRELKTG